MTSSKIWNRLANTFGGLAYMTVCLQWAWLVVTLILPILSEGPIKDFTTPQPDQTNPMPSVELTIPPFLETAILVLSILFTIGVILYAIFMVPRTVSRVGQASVTKVAKVATQQIYRDQSVDSKQKQSLVAKYIWLIKVLIILIPIAALAVPTQLSLDHELVVITGLFLASLSTIGFGLQFAIAKLAKIPTSKLR